MTALKGTYVRIQTLVDGTPRLILDMECKLAELATLNLEPGAEFAVARLVRGSRQAEKPKGGELAKMAGVFCADHRFWGFLADKTGINIASEVQAAMMVRAICGVQSRSEIDHNEQAAQAFHSEIRLPYLDYKQQIG